MCEFVLFVQLRFCEISVDSGATHRHALILKSQGSIVSKSKSLVAFIIRTLLVCWCASWVLHKHSAAFTHLSLLILKHSDILLHSMIVKNKAKTRLWCIV